MHVFARKVWACIVVFFLNTPSSSRGPRKVGTDESLTDRFRATGGVKDTLSKLAKIFPGNTVSSISFTLHITHFKLQKG